MKPNKPPLLHLLDDDPGLEDHMGFDEFLAARRSVREKSPERQTEEPSIHHAIALAGERMAQRRQWQREQELERLRVAALKRHHIKAEFMRRDAALVIQRAVRAPVAVPRKAITPMRPLPLPPTASSPFSLPSLSSLGYPSPPFPPPQLPYLSPPPKSPPHAIPQHAITASSDERGDKGVAASRSSTFYETDTQSLSSPILGSVRSSSSRASVESTSFSPQPTPVRMGSVSHLGLTLDHVPPRCLAVLEAGAVGWRARRAMRSTRGETLRSQLIDVHRLRLECKGEALIVGRQPVGG